MTSTSTGPITIETRLSAEPVDERVRAGVMADLGFGRVFTDHMVSIQWSQDRGWHDAVLCPRRPLELDPATLVFHYGQAVFEGLKAFHQADGSVAAFRPLDHARRFQRSARRLAMPELPEETFIAAIDALVRQDRAWVPTGPGESLYLRPLLLATATGLGVRPSEEYRFLLIASPSGAYFPRGLRPVSVWISTDYTRAAPGGTGEAKCGGNYAASLVAQVQAAEHGCDQVVWLDAVERRWIEEMGGMNIAFVFQEGGTTTVVTPPLTGTLLPGMTRASLLTLAPELGWRAEERRVSVDEWRSGCASGLITEAFACGTAAVVTPIASVKTDRDEWTVADGQPGPVSVRIREALVAIQNGTAPDPHGWLHRIC